MFNMLLISILGFSFVTLWNFDDFQILSHIF